MGFRGRHRNKRDSNEAAVVETLRKHGLSVVHMDKPVDLLCGYGGRTYAVEVKVGDADLSKPQVEFFNAWLGNKTIIRSVADAEQFAREIRGLS